MNTSVEKLIMQLGGFAAELRVNQGARMAVNASDVSLVEAAAAELRRLGESNKELTAALRAMHEASLNGNRGLTEALDMTYAALERAALRGERKG